MVTIPNVERILITQRFSQEILVVEKDYCYNRGMELQPILTCIMPSCGGKVGNRGLCNPHYYAARRLIQQGVLTWDELVSKGQALDVARGGGLGAGKRQSDFLSPEDIASRKINAIATGKFGSKPPKPPSYMGNDSALLG